MNFLDCCHQMTAKLFMLTAKTKSKISEQQESIRLTLVIVKFHNLSTQTQKFFKKILIVINVHFQFYSAFIFITLAEAQILSTSPTKFGSLLSLGQPSAGTFPVPTHTT